MRLFAIVVGSIFVLDLIALAAITIIAIDRLTGQQPQAFVEDR